MVCRLVYGYWEQLLQTILHVGKTNDYFKQALLESGFVPSSKCSPISFYRELGELLSAVFDPKSDSTVISNSAELCLCKILMTIDSGKTKTCRITRSPSSQRKKNSAIADMRDQLSSSRWGRDGGHCLPSFSQ